MNKDSKDSSPKKNSSMKKFLAKLLINSLFGNEQPPSKLDEILNARSIVLSENDKVRGKSAKDELVATGHNPPSWVTDEAKWEKAKAAARKEGYAEDDDTFWAVVAHIYEQMGGETKQVTKNQSNKESESIETPKPNEGDSMKLTDLQRKVLIDSLIANCECWKGNDGRSTLEKMSDDQLKLLGNDQQKHKEHEAVFNAAQKGIKVGKRELVFNAEKASFVPKSSPDDDEDGDDDTPPAHNKNQTNNALVVGDKCPECGATLDASEIANSQCKDCGMKLKTNKKADQTQKPTWKNSREWFDDPESAPSDIKAAVRNAMKIERSQKEHLIERLTANAQDDATKKRLAEKFMTKSLEDLEEIAALIPANNSSPDSDTNSYVGLNFVGNAGGNIRRHKDTELTDDDIAPAPVMNYEKKSKAS